VQGFGLFETADDAATWTPRNRGLRADWPRPHEEVGFCVHKVVRSPVDGDRMYQQNHVGMHRSDDGGQSWTEITDGLPTEFGFAAAAHPQDRDTFYVIPLDPGHGRTMPDGRAAVWPRTRERLAAPRQRRRKPTRGSVCARGMAIDRTTLRREHRPGVRERRRGRGWNEIAATCPRSPWSRSRSSTRKPVADVYLPSTLPPPSRGPAHPGSEATIDQMVDRLEESAGPA
jgi:hypothetical protein